jgi:dnd system-associated protein 4
MERRVAPPGATELVALMDNLTQAVPGSGRSEGIFKSRQKVLMFAAALGVKKGERRPLDKRGESIRYSIFQRAIDDTFIGAVAIAATADLRVLSSERIDERITIFEEYAHAGLAELHTLLSKPGDDLECILQTVMEARNCNEPQEGVIPDLAGLLRFELPGQKSRKTP